MTAPGYVIRSAADCPTYPCDNARCDERVEKQGELCGRCQGRLDAGVDALTDRGRIPICFVVTP